MQIDMFEFDLGQLSKRNRSIIARNREWKKICLMCGFEYKPMPLEK